MSLNMRRAIVPAGFFFLTVLAAPSLAQAQTDLDEPSEPVAQPPPTAPMTGADAEARGEEAFSKKDYKQALRAFEQAYMIEPDGYYIYRRVQIYDEMGDEEQALELLDLERETIVSSERVSNLPVYETMLRNRVESQREVSEVSEVSAPSDPLEFERERPIAPQVLMGVGATSIIVGGLVFVLGRRQALRLRCTPRSPYDESDSRCTEGRRQELDFVDDPEEWNDQVRAARLKQQGGLGALGAGVGLLGAGLIWQIAAGKDPVVSEESLRITPQVGLDQASLTLSLSF